MTAIEAVITALVLAFIVGSVSALYDVGFRQQRLGRRYAQAQTDLRLSLRQVTRTVRHGRKVVVTSSAGTLAGVSSNANQVILEIPQPGGVWVDVLFAVSQSGDLTYQKSTDSNPTIITGGVRSMDIHYYKTMAATTRSATTQVDGAPGTATDVEINLSLTRDGASTSVISYTTLRNKIIGL